MVEIMSEKARKDLALLIFRQHKKPAFQQAFRNGNEQSAIV